MSVDRHHQSVSGSGKGWRWLLITAAVTVLCVVVLGGLILSAVLRQFTQSLPEIRTLKDYHPPMVSSMYAADGTLVAEFYDERRYPVTLKDLPAHLIEAFLAAEDARFYEHDGLDIAGIIRASIKNLRAGEIVQGGSTITQQVVKSLLLTPERTWTRKLKEAFLAYRIDHTLSKDEILYLYLNQIYLGGGAYGVEAAARTYFNKHASQLSLAESAMLAGLPKAPSRYSPYHNYELARSRQHYVLERMVETGFISPVEAKSAFAEPLHITKPHTWSLKDFNTFIEEVRRRVEARYGHKALYREGLQIHTTLNLTAQKYAEEAVRTGLRQLDKRHGFRGPENHLERDEWPQFVSKLQTENSKILSGKIVRALITGYNKASRRFVLNLGNGSAELDLKHSPWPSTTLKAAASKLAPGDVIRVRLTQSFSHQAWLATLDQEPQCEGALLALDPTTGRVLCMVGGKDFQKSQFNRATQALRQPGSAFKPIIYAAALNRGFTPASLLIDSPIIKEDQSLRGPWKPANYDHKFLGPILLRDALIHSRNVVTIKLLDALGIDYVIDFAHRLGIRSELTPTLSLALGASGVSLWELLTAYTVFANQGVRSKPYLIDAIYQQDGEPLQIFKPEQQSVLSAQAAYLITNILQGVIQEGTGRRVRKLGRPAAGKTGTTNDLKDAWFIGYTPATLAGVWVGHDDHRKSLGRKETGSRAASPIWLYFMQKWLKDKPIRNFPIPEDIVFAKVNPKTGQMADSTDPQAVYMAFSKDHMPNRSALGLVNGTPGKHGNSFFKSDLF